jgi:hypothetical protein
VPLLPPWSQPARPGGAFCHRLNGALPGLSITLRQWLAMVDISVLWEGLATLTLTLTLTRATSATHLSMMVIQPRCSWRGDFHPWSDVFMHRQDGAEYIIIMMTSRHKLNANLILSPPPLNYIQTRMYSPPAGRSGIHDIVATS